MTAVTAVIPERSSARQWCLCVCLRKKGCDYGLACCKISIIKMGTANTAPVVRRGICRGGDHEEIYRQEGI